MFVHEGVYTKIENFVFISLLNLEKNLLLVTAAENYYGHNYLGNSHFLFDKMKARSVLSCKYFDLKGFLLDIYI